MELQNISRRDEVFELKRQRFLARGGIVGPAQLPKHPVAINATHPFGPSHLPKRAAAANVTHPKRFHAPPFSRPSRGQIFRNREVDVAGQIFLDRSLPFTFASNATGLSCLDHQVNNHGGNPNCIRSCGACWQVLTQSGHFRRWDRVQIRGLQFEAFNDARGVLCIFFIATGRWFVILNSGIGLAVPSRNLVGEENYLRGSALTWQRSSDHLHRYRSLKRGTLEFHVMHDMHRLGCSCSACVEVDFHSQVGPEPNIIINDLCTESQQRLCRDRKLRGPLSEQARLRRLQSLAQRFKVECLPEGFGDEVVVATCIKLCTFRAWRRYSQRCMHWVKISGCPGRSSRGLGIQSQKKNRAAICLETDAIKHDRCTKAQLQTLFVRLRKARGRAPDQRRAWRANELAVRFGSGCPPARFFEEVFPADGIRGVSLSEKCDCDSVSTKTDIWKVLSACKQLASVQDRRVATGSTLTCWPGSDTRQTDPPAVWWRGVSRSQALSEERQVSLKLSGRRRRQAEVLQGFGAHDFRSGGLAGGHLCREILDVIFLFVDDSLSPEMLCQIFFLVNFRRDGCVRRDEFLFMLRDPMLTLLSIVFCASRQLPPCMPIPRHLRLKVVVKRVRKAYAYAKVTQERGQRLKAKFDGYATRLEPGPLLPGLLPDVHTCCNVALVQERNSGSCVYDFDAIARPTLLDQEEWPSYPKHIQSRRCRLSSFLHCFGMCRKMISAPVHACE